MVEEKANEEVIWQTTKEEQLKQAKVWARKTKVDYLAILENQE